MNIAADIERDKQEAEAFARYGERFPEFEELFRRIEASGFPLGVEGRLRCYVLISRLAALRVTLADATQLADYLVPILAASAREQQGMRDTIAEWAGVAAKPGKELGTRAATEAAAPRETGALAQADRGGTALAVGLGGVAVVAFAALVVFSVISGQSPDPATAARTVVAYSQPMLSLDVGLDPFWRRVLEDALSRAGLAAAVLILGLSFAAWRREVTGRLVRETGETDLVETFGLKANRPDWFRGPAARLAFDRLKRVRRFDTNLIDVPRTVARSTRAGGLPLIVTRQYRELPNYVLLVDRVARDDLEGIFARAVESALGEARIVYSRYDFSGTLDRLNPVRGGGDTDVVDAEYLPFAVIASRHAGERLIVIGTGKAFFETPGFRYDLEGNRTLVRPGTPIAQIIHLREFSAAALVTPTPVSAWGENEQRLNDLGLEVHSADVAGIRNLAARLMSEPGATPPALPEQSDEGWFLAQLDRDAMRLSAEMPPDREKSRDAQPQGEAPSSAQSPSRRSEIDRLVRNLRIWLGDPQLYMLLAAIAAFPKIESGFTFALAEMLLGKDKLDSAQFARLVRLPWIRNGYMPEWLRIALVNGLDAEQRERVKQAQLAMLKGADQAREQPAPPTLDQLVGNFDVARQLSPGVFAALISRLQPRNILSADERIFFSVLRDYRLDPMREAIEPEAPEIIADMIDAPERARRAQIRAVVIGLAALAALLQPWIWMGLTIAGKAADDWLQAASRTIGSSAALLPGWQAVTLAMSALAMALWLFNAMRREPRDFPRTSLLRFVLPQFMDPRRSAWPGLAGGVFLLFGPRTGPAVSDDPAFLTSLIVLAAAAVVLAWVSFVRPEHWWNPQSADAMLRMQAARDPLTGTLGTLLVVAVWAVPWFLWVLPVMTRVSSAASPIPPAACVGAAAWVASAALARRWLLGRDATGQLHRYWMDAGFALIAFLVLAGTWRLARPLLDVVFPSAPIFPSILVWFAAPALYALHLKATVGLRHQPQPVWSPLINAAFAGLSATLLLATAVVASGTGPRGEPYLLTIPMGLIGGFACSILAVFLFRRSDYPGGTSVQFRIRGVLLGTLFFLGATALGYLVSDVLPGDRLDRVANRVTRETLGWFVLPAALVVWPMFRVLLPATRVVEPVPWSRAIFDSPWWATPPMWLVGLVWHSGVSPFAVWPFAPDLAPGDVALFSFWPLALPIAIFYAWRHGERALVPLLVGTLPLVFSLGASARGSIYTPGGLWPAIAILFLARFAADAQFRARILRREHLSWPEAFLIVAVLSTDFSVMLGSVGVEDTSKIPVAGSPVRFPGIPAHLLLDPDAMLTAVAFVIGASRIPIAPFAVAVIAAWIARDVPWIMQVKDPWATIGFGLTSVNAIGPLLVLYGARAWRNYASSTKLLDLKPNSASDPDDPHLARPRLHGLVLSCAAAFSVAIAFSGAAPAFRFPSADGTQLTMFITPNMVAILAVLFLGGLMTADLWRDRVAWRIPGLSLQLSSSAALIPFGAMVICIALARILGAVAFDALGVGVSRFDTIPSILGVTGFAVCFVGYVVFGIALRINAEQERGETWMSAAYRIFGVQFRKLPAAEVESEPDPDEAVGSRVQRAVAGIAQRFVTEERELETPQPPQAESPSKGKDQDSDTPPLRQSRPIETSSRSRRASGMEEAEE